MTQVNQLAKVQGRIDTVTEDARIALGSRQEQLIDSMQKGYALSASLVESIFMHEQLVRVWQQVQGLSRKATGETELKAQLSTWVEDAVEQLTSPGMSRSTSLVRTEQQVCETEALKTVTRTVSRLVSLLALN